MININREQVKNNHLNLFHFYGQSGKQYLEDNLTRGLAICLENDPILLDRFLREIMNEHYNGLFTTEGQSTELFIDVQKRSKSFEGIQTVYGVPLTTQELDFDGKNDPKGVDNPITDLSIQIGDQLILIEVKRTAEDCRKQLQNQIEVLADVNDGTAQKREVDTFSWGNLMELFRHTLKFESEVTSENLFTHHYYHFVKRQFPAWFAIIPFSEIHFPDNLEENPKLKEHLEVRLNLIKQQMLDTWNTEKNTEHELVFNRANIPVDDYDWVDEINIEPIRDKETGEKCIAVKAWPGDTKTQGYSIFKKGKTFDWPQYIYKEDYKFIVRPYLKFSHMQGLCWVRTKDRENPITHTKEFFKNYTGKWKRGEEKNWIKKGVSWEDFDRKLKEVNEDGVDWKISSEFQSKITDSQRSYFYVSSGFAIEVRLPYNIVKEIDGRKDKDGNAMAKELKKVSEELLSELDRQFSN